MNDRLEAVMVKLNLNQNTLAKCLGMSKTVVFNIISPTGRRNAPSHKFYEALKAAFDNINLNWLITGQGTMFTEDVQAKEDKGVQPILNEPNVDYGKENSADRDIYAILKEIRTNVRCISERVDKLEKAD